MRRNSLALSLALAIGLATATTATAVAATPAKATTTAKASAATAGLTKGPCVQGVCEYTLANGMHVLLVPDASNGQTTVNIMYGVGSVQEGNGETGMAHLLEHLQFKGTPKHTNIPEEMKAHGVKYNATTSLDRTNYFGQFPASDKTLEWLLDLEADRMVNSFIARKDLDSEMTVVRNEMENGENNPVNAAHERLMSTAYLWHNYGKNTIGARSDVEQVQIPNLQAFYRNWYRPANATLVIGGRFNPDLALKQVQKAFGNIKNPAQPLPKYYTVEPTQDGERRVEVRRPGDIKLAFIGYHVPAATSPDTAPLQVLNNILSYQPTGRLYKALVETKLAVQAGLGAQASRDPGLATGMVVVSKDGDVAKAEQAFEQIVENLAQNPITQEELDQAQQRVAASIARADDDANATALGLTGAFAQGDWRLYFYQRDAISKVTLADVNRVAKAYYLPSNRTVSTFIPDANPQRAVIAAAPLAADVLKNYKGGEAKQAGEQFDGTPTHIEKRVERLQLTPTLKAVLLPYKTRGASVQVAGQFRFGNEKELYGVYPNAFVGGLLMMGAKDLTRDQISKQLTALKAGGSVSGGSQSLSLRADAQRDSVVPVIQLLTQVARTATVPDAEFEQARTQAITSLEMQRQEPQTLASEAMAAHFNVWPKGHPSAYRPLAERIAEIKALKVEDLRAFKQQFYGTAQGEVTIVGDFDPAAVKAELSKAFPGWTSNVKYAPISTRYNAIAPVTERLNAPDKANAFVLARVNMPLNDTDPDYPALRVANDILGGSTLKSRLGDRLRQKEGLTYGVSSQIRADFSLEGHDDDGYLMIYGITAPENAEKFTAGVRDELAKFVATGVTEEEVKTAVADILSSRTTALTKEQSLVSVLADQAYRGETMADYARRTEVYSKLTAAQVNAAIRAKIKPEALSVFMAGDLSKFKK